MVSIWQAIILGVFSQLVMADFMSVQVTPATQCGRSTVTWSGDDGPWHLLLTPTDFVQHGYNLWVPEIPTNYTNWTIPIRQPAGMNFMVTMWGASGIRFAGTTDILTVLNPVNATNATCYLNDTEILEQYTFSFNISDISSGYPPQCSNLSMSWPSSLESPVTPPLTGLRNGMIDSNSMANPYPFIPAGIDAVKRQLINDNPSSSDRTNGNTTKPPSMFGIIPMGNSFQIPITFSRQAAFAYKLPEDVISDKPSTWTRQGVTNLNWTIPLAKGTRFILVAGIGDDQQWASGGSSRMMTVGQGSEGCTWPEEGSGGSVTTDVPSVTGSSTATPSIRYPDDSTRGSSQQGGMAVGTIIACVLSVLATLVIVGLCFCCCRIRRGRRAAAALTAYRDPNPKRGLPPSESELPLDLISSRSDQHYTPHQLAPLDTSPTLLNRAQTSPTTSDPFRDTPHDRYRSLPRIDALRGERSEVTSPTALGTGTVASPGGWTRQASQEALLHSSLTSPVTASGSAGSGFGMGINTGSYPYPSYPSLSRTAGLGMGTHDTAESLREMHERERQQRERDLPDLKRDVIAFLGDAPGGRAGAGTGAGAGMASGSGGPGRAGRRVEDDDVDNDSDLQYVVHRDAGRPRVQRVMELPPRYEELNWDGEGVAPGTSGEVMGGTGSGAHERMDESAGTDSGSVDRPGMMLSPSSPSGTAPTSTGLALETLEQGGGLGVGDDARDARDATGGARSVSPNRAEKQG